MQSLMIITSPRALVLTWSISFSSAAFFNLGSQTTNIAGCGSGPASGVNDVMRCVNLREDNTNLLLTTASLKTQVAARRTISASSTAKVQC